MATAEARAHAEFPVRKGDLWQVGRHLMLCGDIEAGDLARFPAVDYGLAIAAPPWSASAMRNYRRAAGLPPNTDLNAFTYDLMRQLRERCPRAIIEMGPQLLPTLQRTIRQNGGTVRHIWDTTYPAANRRSLSHILAVDWTDLDTFGDVSGLPEPPTHEEAPVWVCPHFLPPGTYLLEPCVGRGGFALGAEAVGASCHGMDIAADRIALTLQRLRDATGATPALLERLDK